MTPSEIYMHHYQNSEPKFYTRVPNIIDHLTYEVEEDGNKTVKRLSVYAKELYRVIRMIASDHGKDWHTTESLAEIVGCSVGSIVNAKKELLMPMMQLENSPLIIEHRTPVKKIVNEKTVKTVLCKREIVDIWKWNNAFMATVNHQDKFGRAPDSCDESAWAPDSCDESATQGAHSCGEANKINNKKIPLSKEQQPTAIADPVCSLDTRCSSVLAAAPEDDIPNRHNFNILSRMGFDVLTATSLVNTFSGEVLRSAQLYLEAQEKKKPIQNRLGYFRKILDGKWWLRST